MRITDDDRIRSSPRDLKDPQSYEYARQMVYVLKRCWNCAVFDLQYWHKELNEARRNEIWKNHKPKYDSLEDMLRSEIGYDPKQIESKVKAAKENPLPKHGEVGNGRDSRGDNVTSTDRGNSQSYTLRRLARDGREDLLDKVAAGEISANAAAIEAGFRKKQTPDEQCVRAFRKAENHQETLSRLFDWLEHIDGGREILRELSPELLNRIAEWTK